MALLVALLTLSVAATAMLAYQAQDAARSHRATAERALRDYATFTALEFAVNAKEGIWNAMYARLYRPTDLGGAPTSMYRVPPSLDSIPAGARQCEHAGSDTIPFYFRLDLDTHTIPVSRGCATPETRAWLRDTVPAYTQQYAKADWELGHIVSTVAGTPRVAAFVFRRDANGVPVRVYGFSQPYAPFAGHVFDEIYRYYPLLPPALVGEIPTDSMLSVVVRDLEGHTLYASAAQYPATYTGHQEMEKFGRFEVTVALRPSLADRLVIGGLPRSRLPLLLALALVSVGLVITALHQLRREYELARLRADFISGISHELRTPLAQVRMFAETLLLGRVRSDTERRRSLEIIDQEARRLTHLVENVLQFSRAERRLSRLSPEPTELAGQLREAIEAFAPIAQARRVEVRAELEEGIIANVDRGALRQTLVNLLDNAVKYGPPGQTVRVALSLGGSRARIAVDDEGPGIPDDKRARIWEPFFRLDRDASSAVAGSGIGLSVVAELVALHGGRVWVETAPLPGGGARFVVELPAARCVPGELHQGAPDDDAGAADAGTTGAPGEAAREPSKSREVPL